MKHFKVTQTGEPPQCGCGGKWPCLLWKPRLASLEDVRRDREEVNERFAPAFRVLSDSENPRPGLCSDG